MTYTSGYEALALPLEVCFSRALHCSRKSSKVPDHWEWGVAEIISISSFFPLPGTTDTELLHLQRSEGAKGFSPTDEIGAEVAHVGFPGASLSFHHPSPQAACLQQGSCNPMAISAAQSFHSWVEQICWFSGAPCLSNKQQF